MELSEADGNSRSVRVPVRLRANNGDALLQAAISGLGITVMPTFIGHDALVQGLLRPILTSYSLPTETAYVIYPSQHYLPQRIRVLIDLLVESFGDNPYWDEWE